MSNMLKTASATFIAAEEARTRKPIELYEFTNLGVDDLGDPCEVYRYTSSDEPWSIPPADYDDPYDVGTLYSTEAVRRSALSQSETLEAAEVTIELPLTATVVARYSTNNPLNKTTVKIRRTFSGLDSEDDDSYLTIFYGLVTGVLFKGSQAVFRCASFEHLLLNTAPRRKYNLVCSWKLGDDNCTFDLSTVKLTAQVAVSADGKTLTSTSFLGLVDDVYALGYVEYLGRKALIVANDGTLGTVTMMHALPDVISETGVTDPTVDVYPGCDGKITTCSGVYSMEDYFGGFPLLPPDNPSQWKWR